VKLGILFIHEPNMGMGMKKIDLAFITHKQQLHIKNVHIEIYVKQLMYKKHQTHQRHS